MHFDLRRPCPECPFRRDVHPFLSAERAFEIANTILTEGRTFTCHKHLNGEHVNVELTEEEEEAGADEQVYRPAINDQHCAGAMAMVDKTGVPHQMLQVAERLGLRNPNRLDPACLDQVFDSAEEMAAHHARCTRKR